MTQNISLPYPSKASNQKPSAMRNYLLLFLFAFVQYVNAQINPIGFKMTLKGEVKIITKDQYIDYSNRIDSVRVICEDDTKVFSPHQFSQRYLMFMDPPDKNWTDASLIPRNTEADGGSNSKKGEMLSRLEAPVLVIPQDQIIYKIEKAQFEDEVIFHGELNPDLKSYFSKLLDNHIEKYKGVAEDDEEWDEIGDLLSYEDTVENEGFIYPAMVDKLVFYKYEGEKLSTITGYYFNITALERDSLVYDNRGNLIYFHRESIGSGGERLYFKYNDKNQVIEFKSDYYDFHSDSYDECPSCKVVTEYEHFVFEYDEKGYLKSKDNQTNQYTPFCKLKVFHP